MKVFLSWSGIRSKAVASALKNLLPDILLGIETWMSDDDIAAGSKWGEELSKGLDDCFFGIICLTPENTIAPWLLFEAGALSKSIASAQVIPYCFELDATKVSFPLAQFQSATVNKEGTLKMVNSINELMENKVPKDRLSRNFERWWPDFERLLNQIPKSSNTTGLEISVLTQVYCAYTEEFVNLGVEEDIKILDTYFPGRVFIRSNINKLQMVEDLTTSKYEILHLIGRFDPKLGDFFFGVDRTEKIKLDGLKSLVEKCGAKLIFLATCDSTVPGSGLERTASVIAAYGKVGFKLMIDWERIFYSLLVKGVPLVEAYDQAQAINDIPMTSHIKSNIIFLV